ncbi:hypothetical protein HPP92_019506 [Vanilla planifolia]|uniref:Uncharacterized protein n=1 Tax=Vanilla planifolia TaxID=51239 RepID=A0A835Q8Y7_VANPL|nr:hypothetical protein HPP92_019506 [Vanilla planifolia]
MSSLPFQLIQPPFLRNPPSPSSPLSQSCSPDAPKGQKKLNRHRPAALPELVALNHKQEPAHNADSSLEGVTANVKLILKILQEHKDASNSKDDSRKPYRLAGMLSILDDVRLRIELCSKRCPPREAELRRCNTDLRQRPSSSIVSSSTSSVIPSCGALSPRGQATRKISSSPADENQKLRRELSASITARKSLERMFSSLGKEKEMIANELARKVQELSYMEELVGDLKTQNEMLSAKVRAYAASGRSKNGVSGEEEVIRELLERNRELSEELVKSLEGYKAAKRKLKEEQEESARVKAEVAELAAAAVERMRRVREDGCPVEEIVQLVKI